MTYHEFNKNKSDLSGSNSKLTRIKISTQSELINQINSQISTYFDNNVK